ncbi:hypothetical protein CEXT_110961 [Caerostris extrusa]|uniref:Uncharacterized protein n=1 Tax=Caerostris extrusa TaxID=172846 RepID=A0AAV4X3F8_CAEEX|nr:hypothetical protein CEXT_110961 [Caerostris extrusa]
MEKMLRGGCRSSAIYRDILLPVGVVANLIAKRVKVEGAGRQTMSFPLQFGLEGDGGMLRLIALSKNRLLGLARAIVSLFWSVFKVKWW